MPRITLTEARVRALAPRNSAYDVRDTKLKGFGVRVLPSGTRRFFIHAQHRGQRIWKALGEPNAMTVIDARAHAVSLLTEIREGPNSSASSNATRFEIVAENVFQLYSRVWKPQTLLVNRSYLRRQILPSFTGRHIADITRQDVQRWFASLRATPVSADRSMPVLSVILREAELLGYRPEGSNPCWGIRRYRRKGRERFLSDDEIARVAAALSSHETEWPLETAAIRLLMLTGCRKGEVVTLRWTDYRDGHLFLRDSKTGPRTVWLSRAAREVIERIPGTSAWMFPLGQANRPRPRTWLLKFWWQVRGRLDLPDVRLHDLRHTYATFALRHGESVLSIGRLLGHNSPETTLKYTHAADAMVREAAELVGTALKG